MDDADSYLDSLAGGRPLPLRVVRPVPSSLVFSQHIMLNDSYITAPYTCLANCWTSTRSLKTVVASTTRDDGNEWACHRGNVNKKVSLGSDDE
jgi:hypothetical protein